MLLPVLLVDEVLPMLKDTELRVLLIVLRQTHVAGKETDKCWLTHRELCRRTGRASEAVSGAVEKLVDKGLLCVTDEAGRRLHTTSQRQQIMGRHFYRVTYLNNKAHSIDLNTDCYTPKWAAGKSKTIEDINKPYSLRKTEGVDILPTISLSPEEKHRIEAEKARIRENLQRLSPGV